MSYLDGRRSSFPEEMDTILELFNLPASQRGNLTRFQTLKAKASLSEDEKRELNNLTVSLQHYIIDPETWNYFGDVLVNMQSFFKEGLEPYVDERKQEFQDEVDKFTFKGEWQPNTQYVQKNVVTFEGEGYIASQDSINMSPMSGAHWNKVAARGAKGDPSLNISYKGEYDSSVSYVLGDAVTYGQLWYYAKKNTKGNPPTNLEHWELQMNQALVSDVEPFDSRITIWINTGL